MAAEPAPPGPPDDGEVRAYLRALDDRVADLEYYRRHEAPHASQAAGLGLEIVRQEQRDQSVMLTRVIQRQDQDGATLRDLVEGQQAQGEVLEGIGRALDLRGRQLDRVERRHDEQQQLLEEILRRLPPAADGQIERRSGGPRSFAY